jgi:hypothetical protein
MDIFAKQQWHCPPGSRRVNLISCDPPRWFAPPTNFMRGEEYAWVGLPQQHKLWPAFFLPVIHPEFHVVFRICDGGSGAVCMVWWMAACLLMCVLLGKACCGVSLDTVPGVCEEGSCMIGLRPSNPTCGQPRFSLSKILNIVFGIVGRGSGPVHRVW